MSKPKRPTKPAKRKKTISFIEDVENSEIKAANREKQLANLQMFKPGQSGNPGGRPADTPELKAFKNLTKKELVEVGNLVIKGNLKALKALAKDENATVLQMMLAACCVRVIEKGDWNTLDGYLNRMIGKVRDEVLHEGLQQGNAPQIIVTLPSNGRESKT